MSSSWCEDHTLGNSRERMRDEWQLVFNSEQGGRAPSSSRAVRVGKYAGTAKRRIPSKPGKLLREHREQHVKEHCGIMQFLKQRPFGTGVSKVSGIGDGTVFFLAGLIYH